MSSSRAIPARSLWAVLTLIGVGLACSDESAIGPGGVRSVRIVPDTLHVVLGTTDTARAFPLDADSAFLPTVPVTWSVVDPAIASVGSKGDVTGLALGKTQLVAAAEGQNDTSIVVVDPVPTFLFLPDTARITGIALSGTQSLETDSIKNGGGGTITGITLDSITYLSGSGWLQATLSGTATPAGVDLTANSAGLPLGTYQALVWFSSPSATPTTAAYPVKFTLGADTPTQIALSGGNSQTAQVGTAVAQAPTVLVTDQFTNPVSGVSVTFAVTGGGGSVVGSNAVTNAAGLASVASWTLGTTAGANSLSATAPGLQGSPIGFTATGTPGPAAQIVVNAGDNQAATAGTAVTIPPSVKVGDQFGNGVAGVSVTFAVASGGGSITGPNQTTNASGIATVGSWTLGAVAGANTLSATSTGLTGSPVTFTATGNPGNASNIALSSGNSQTATVATTLPQPYAVLVTDALSNPVQGVTVGWAVTTGGGNINPTSSVTNASGIATATHTLGGTAGTQTATATVGGLTGSPVTFTANATAGAATQILVSAGNNQTATVNTAVAVDPAAIARDAFNNPVPNVAITFAVTAGGGTVNCGAGNTTNCNVTTNASGIATVTAWTLGTASGTGNNTLSATRTGATGTSFSASATAGAVASVAINAGNNQTVRQGTAVPTDPSVVVRDAFNNLVPNATVTFTVTAGGGQVNCGLGNTTSCSTTSNASGIATVASWTMGGTGSGIPTVSAPTLGRYTNTLQATSNAQSTSFTGFGIWSFVLDVQPMLSSFGCQGCHGFFTYASIVNMATSCGGTTVHYITPSSTANSLIYQKIVSSATAAASCAGGVQMPQGGPFMTQSQYDRFRDWILNGAPNN